MIQNQNYFIYVSCCINQNQTMVKVNYLASPSYLVIEYYSIKMDFIKEPMAVDLSYQMKKVVITMELMIVNFFDYCSNYYCFQMY
jgi:hypothetical protein